MILLETTNYLIGFLPALFMIFFFLYVVGNGYRNNAKLTKLEKEVAKATTKEAVIRTRSRVTDLWKSCDQPDQIKRIWAMDDKLDKKLEELNLNHQS